MVKMLIWHQSITFDTSNKSHKLQIVTSNISFHCLSITCPKWREKNEVIAACFESFVLLQCNCSLPIFFFVHPSLLTSHWQPSIVPSSNLTSDWQLKLQNWNFGQKSQPNSKNKAKMFDGWLSALIVRIQSWGRPQGWQFYKEKRYRHDR